MGARRAVLALGSAALIGGACADGPAGPDGIESLRREVSVLRDSVDALLRPDTLPPGSDTDVLVALDLELVRGIVAEAGRRYLDDVRLHLRPEAVVTEGDEVRVRIGPIRVYAGRWDLAVTILRIDASMHADEITIEVADTARLRAVVPVQLRDGSGDARIQFRWDAATVASVVCSDFEVDETFAATVEPRRYDVTGFFELAVAGDTVFARPRVEQRITVQPRPTQQAWRRVRQILESQNDIFECGLALSPSRMEAMLRDLLEEGFRFRLPSSILRPIPLPASIVDNLDVAGRRISVRVRPRPPRLDHGRLWVAAEVEARGQ